MDALILYLDEGQVHSLMLNYVGSISYSDLHGDRYIVIRDTYESKLKEFETRRIISITITT